jgi:hypothetical protein
MSNLTRPTVDVLLNTLTKDDFGMYFDTADKKHLVLKKLGFDFQGDRVKYKVLSSAAGQKMVRTLTPTWKWNGEASQLFEIEITNQPLYDSTPENQFAVSKFYNFNMTGFSTTTMGTLNNTDKDAILNGLKAVIEEDVQLNQNAIHTGAVVTVAVTSQTLVLTSKVNGDIFTVQTYDGQFSQPVNPTTPQIKDKMPTVDIQRIFSIKEEEVGTVKEMPIAGVPYSCIVITAVTPFVGLDLLGGQGQMVEQSVRLYTPTSQLAVDVIDLPADATANAAGMAGTTPDSTIVEGLAALIA